MSDACTVCPPDECLGRYGDCPSRTRDFEFLLPEPVTMNLGAWPRRGLALPTFEFSFRLPMPDFSVFDSKEPIE